PAPSGAGFRTVADWGAGFSRNRAAALSAGLEKRLLDLAEGLFFDLVASQATPILLHGDLHHYNIVRDEARGWLAIDPKGVLGEPAYEAGALIRNPIGEPGLCADSGVAARRASLIAGRLEWDRKRIVGWGFSQWMLAVLWALHGGGAFASEWMAGPLALESLL
ncbi:MAG: aminoglycoside phosphotransferase family protein, partial [Caulobacteraceae bacterium]